MSCLKSYRRKRVLARQGAAFPSGTTSGPGSTPHPGAPPLPWTSSRMRTDTFGLSRMSWVPVGAAMPQLTALNHTSSNVPPETAGVPAPQVSVDLCVHEDRGNAAPNWGEGVKHGPAPWGGCGEHIRGLPVPQLLCCFVVARPLPGRGRSCQFAKCPCQWKLNIRS